MKIAVSGKGGVGKTTISASLIRYYAQKGYQVYAVDADPDVSLGTVLGLRSEVVDRLTPVVEMREVIARRTGGSGAYFSLNPDVEDLLDQYCLQLGNIRFIKMGAVKQGGSACYCRENSVLNALVGSLVLDKKEVVVLDMGAGIEHLTRGTARGVDLMLVVTEPSRVSLQTAGVVHKLAGELGIKRLKYIGNKIRNEQEKRFLLQNLGPEQIIGFVEFHESVLESSMDFQYQNETPLELQNSIAPIAEQILLEVGEG